MNNNLFFQFISVQLSLIIFFIDLANIKWTLIPSPVNPSRGKISGRPDQVGGMPRSARQMPPRSPAAQRTRVQVGRSDAFQKAVRLIF